MTVDPQVVLDECARDRTDIIAPEYLEVAVAIEPEVRTPRVVKPKPRLSTGESPVVAEQDGDAWVLRCTGCGAASEPKPYRWQALDETVACVCE